MRSALRNSTSRYFCGLSTPVIWVLFVSAVCFISEAVPACAETGAGVVSQPDAAARARAMESYGKLPVSFEANAGQTDQRVKFLSRGRQYTLSLTSNEAVLALRTTASGTQKTVNRNEVAGQRSKAAPVSRGHIPVRDSESRASAILRMKLVGANPAAAISGLEQLPGTSNYFIGNDPKKWRTAVPNYAKVRYQDVYPGVDLVYYGNQRQLEYDFVVAPGADPGAIKLDFAGTVGGPGKKTPRASLLRVDRNGDLVVRLNGGAVSFHKPTVYQLESDSTTKNIVEASYVVHPNGQVGIRLAAYDHTRALTIDPTLLVYSSYLGGSSWDSGDAIAMDSSGDLYVAGHTGSSDFPIVNQIPGACRGSCGSGLNSDVLVIKINAAGNALVYSSYIGGSDDDGPIGIAVDGFGSAYVTGSTYSSDFPTVNQIPDACRGNCSRGGHLYNDAFVFKIDAAGSALVYSSYLGGSIYDTGFAIAVDTMGNAHLTGDTASSDFPIVNQIPGACRGACGTGYSGVGFLIDINAAGSALIYSSFIGGSGGDTATSIALGSAGSTYLTGNTESSDFPVVNQIPGACRGSCGSGGSVNDAFVIKINADASALVYSSYIGGSGDDYGDAVAVDRSGNTYVVADTASSDFPIVMQIPGACRGSCGSGGGYVVSITKINADGSALIYSSYLGGSNNDFGAYGIALDRSSNLYVAGWAQSSDFPVVDQIPGACQGSCGTGYPGDVFVTEINAAGSQLVYSSYLGGSGMDLGYGIAVDGFGNAYVTGYTSSSDFPTVHQIPGACRGACGSEGGSDAFVTKILYVGPTAR